MGNNRNNIQIIIPINIKDMMPINIKDMMPINIKDMMLAHYKEIMKVQLREGLIYKHKGQLDLVLHNNIKISKVLESILLQKWLKLVNKEEHHHKWLVYQCLNHPLEDLEEF
jgi:hypothetical protein